MGIIKLKRGLQTNTPALTLQPGEPAIALDSGDLYIGLTTGKELINPIKSVNSKTGNVVLSKEDVGLSNVANESKATMFSSPTFTGSPVAPTPTTTDNTTKIATTGFVKANISALTKSDVGLSNVANESKATMFTSPTLTGSPVAPTQATSDNSTKIATTGFVQSVINAIPSDIDGGTF